MLPRIPVHDGTLSGWHDVGSKSAHSNYRSHSSVLKAAPDRTNQDTHSSLTGTTVCPESINVQDVRRTLANLAFRFDKQQEELNFLSRHVHEEFALAKRATLTPMWKERALHEIAQGELRNVCAVEVAKALKVVGLDPELPSKIKQLLSLLQDGEEISRSTITSEKQYHDLLLQIDEGAAARAVMVECCSALEENQKHCLNKVDALSEDVKMIKEVVKEKTSGQDEVKQDLVELKARTNNISSHCSAVEALVVELQKILSASVSDIRGEISIQGTSIANVKDELATSSLFSTCSLELSRLNALIADLSIVVARTDNIETDAANLTELLRIQNLRIDALEKARDTDVEIITASVPTPNKSLQEDLIHKASQIETTGGDPALEVAAQFVKEIFNSTLAAKINPSKQEYLNDDCKTSRHLCGTKDLLAPANSIRPESHHPAQSVQSNTTSMHKIREQRSSDSVVSVLQVSASSLEGSCSDLCADIVHNLFL